MCYARRGFDSKSGVKKKKNESLVKKKEKEKFTEIHSFIHNFVFC